MVQTVVARPDDATLTANHQLIPADQDLHLATRKSANFGPHHEFPVRFEDFDRRTPWCKTCMTAPVERGPEVEGDVDLNVRPYRLRSAPSP